MDTADRASLYRSRWTVCLRLPQRALLLRRLRQHCPRNGARLRRILLYAAADLGRKGMALSPPIWSIARCAPYHRYCRRTLPMDTRFRERPRAHTSGGLLHAWGGHIRGLPCLPRRLLRPLYPRLHPLSNTLRGTRRITVGEVGLEVLTLRPHSPFGVHPAGEGRPYGAQPRALGGSCLGRGAHGRGQSGLELEPLGA